MSSSVASGRRDRRPIRLTPDRIAMISALSVLVTVVALAGLIPRPVALALEVALTSFWALGVGSVERQRNRLRRSAAAMSSAAPYPVEGPIVRPPAVATLVEQLGIHGFRDVGTTDTPLPGRKPFRTWILVEPSGETWAEVAEGVRGIGVLLSSTRGGRQVEVKWPGGMAIDEPELLAARASPTLELTLADHRARLAAERRSEAALGVASADPSRPEGWRIHSLDDYLAWEPIQRARTGGMRLRADLRNRIQPALRLLAAATVVGIGSSLVLAVVR